MTTKTVTSAMGALFIQPGGPNTEPIYWHDVQLDTVTKPRGGSRSVRIRKKDHSGWETVAQIATPPGDVTTTVTGLMHTDAEEIEKIKCPFGLYALTIDCADSDLFSGYVRGTVMTDVTITEESLTNLVNNMPEAEDATGNLSASLTGSDAIRVFGMAIDRKATTEAQALNDIWGNRDERCQNDCGATIGSGKYLYAAADAGAGTANVQKSTDYGETWSALAADPFGAGLNAMAVTRFQIGRNKYRLVASQEGTGGAAQGHVAYSDDEGATWTTINIGGAGVGHGATKGGGLFSLDRTHIWLASAGGYIYRSTDGGATWTAVDAGVVTAGNYTQIHFCDDLYGMAVAAAGVVAKTTDGGVTWTAATTITGTPALNTVHVLDASRAWVGTATGKIYFTTDGGVTWTERTGWVGCGVGAVKDVQFLNPYIGFMAVNDGGPVGSILRTINGGYSWEVIATAPTNAGLNRIFAADANTVYAVGEVETATAVILKAA